MAIAQCKQVTLCCSKHSAGVRLSLVQHLPPQHFDSCQSAGTITLSLGKMEEWHCTHGSETSGNLLLPLSKKSSVFPHHSESAPSSPSPFLLLCESPDGNRNHNYRPSSRINSSSALATLLKSNILLLYSEKALKKKLRAQGSEENSIIFLLLEFKDSVSERETP